MSIPVWKWVPQERLFFILQQLQDSPCWAIPPPVPTMRACQEPSPPGGRERGA